MSLILFNQPRPPRNMPNRDEWDQARAREQKWQETILRDVGAAQFEANSHKYREQARIEAKRETWGSQVPRDLTDQIPFIYAKTFLYSLDSINKIMQKFKPISDKPDVMQSILDDFESAFPKLKHVRDSAHHPEDRSRQQKGEKKITTQPLVNNVINAPSGGVFMMDVLNGINYGNTLADGIYAEVEVSEQSARKVQELIQRAIDSFDWDGFPTHYPIR